MALSANVKRQIEFNSDEVITDQPVAASVQIFEGAALGWASGYVRPFNDGDVFAGFAVNGVDNSSGTAGAKDVRVSQVGTALLTVGGTLAVTDVNAVVYATADDTFSKTDSGSDTTIGKIARFLTTTTAMVRYEAAAIRSI